MEYKSYSLLGARLLIFIPIVLSSFTHLWNPIGFPSIFVDEGHYMRRAVHLLDGFGPQESTNVYTKQYDHPYFGQIFLAAALSLIGYPDSVIGTEDDSMQTAENLYLIPRVLMGLLAVVDTFLIYKIAETRYNRKVALIAAILFAVMPISWMTRRILLESIILPLILSSVLFALHRKQTTELRSGKRNIIFPLMSGIFLGLAIFTKLLAIGIVPLLVLLIYFNNKEPKSIAMFLIPVIVIPLLWPAYAMYIGNLDAWFDGLLWQSDREVKPLSDSVKSFFKLDPLFFIVGFTGLVVAVLKRDFFPLIWIAPFLILFSTLEHSKVYFWILLLPAFCIAGAILVTELSDRIGKNRRRVKQLLPFVTISAIALFGLASTLLLISTNINSSFFKLYGFVIDYVKAHGNDNQDSKVTMVGDHWIASFVWIPKDVLDKDIEFLKFYSNKPIKTPHVLLFVSESFEGYIEEQLFRGKKVPMDEEKKILFDDTDTITRESDEDSQFNKNIYPYTNMVENRGIGEIEIKAN